MAIIQGILGLSMIDNYEIDNKTVNPFVAGSSPARGAKFYKKDVVKGVLFCFLLAKLCFAMKAVS